MSVGLSVLAQRGICFNRFWSSDKLTGNQTAHVTRTRTITFWSSDKLTGNQTIKTAIIPLGKFWSSDKLTGNQTSMG